MAQLPQGLRMQMGFMAGLSLSLLLGSTCCVSLGDFAFKEVPPKAMVAKVVPTWVPGVGTTPNNMDNGAPIHALGGKVYFFGPDMAHTVGVDGSLVVDLYDSNRIDPQSGQPFMLERWTFDPATLNQQCLKRDAFGWGYTLLLPWVKSYRRDITRVELRVRYQPKEGVPLFADPATVTLGGQGDQPLFDQRQVAAKR